MISKDIIWVLEKTVTLLCRKLVKTLWTMRTKSSTVSSHDGNMCSWCNMMVFAVYLSGLSTPNSKDLPNYLSLTHQKTQVQEHCNTPVEVMKRNRSLRSFRGQQIWFVVFLVGSSGRELTGGKEILVNSVGSFIMKKEPY